MTTNKIRLLVADDHEVVRSGLKSMFANTEIKVVGEVSTGAAAVKFALDTRPPCPARGRLRLCAPSL